MRASATEPDDLNVRLHQTEMLINIFRPVMECHGHWEPEFDDDIDLERGFHPEDRIIVLNDAALNVHYTTVDPQLEAIRANRGDRDNVRFLTAFHVLNRIQETWLVKFTAELSARDTWGRIFLDKLNGFSDELQKLTSRIHTMVTSTPMVRPGQYDDEYFDLTGIWDDTAMKFFCLLLFLFDVGITPEAEQYEYYDEARFHESPAFSSTSAFRSRILTNAAFITHLGMCAWKVLTVSWGIRQPYELNRLAIPPVCDELRARIVGIVRGMRQEYARNRDRRQVESAIKMALDWRSEWERAGSAGVGGMQENYRKALAELQQEHAVKLALFLRDKPENLQPERSDLTVARLLTLLQDAKESPYTSALCCSASH